MADKFRLIIIGADEDVPRLLLAYGRACGGEAAFAMRPRDGTAVLVHQVKKQPAKVWRTDLGLAPSHPPELDAAPAEAVAEIKRVKANPPPAGPATLRGKWTGTLHCDDGTPRVTLERRVASYGTLKLASKADGRWVATFERAGKWFSKAKQESVERSGLAETIQAGMGLVIGLVSEACSFRDTRRRNTVDADYAAQHPYVPPREAKDPTDRMQAPKSRTYSLKGDDTGWSVVDFMGNVVTRFGAREKGKAEKHLRSLNAAPTATVAPDLADAFGIRGMPGVTVPALAELPPVTVPGSPSAVQAANTDAQQEAAALESIAASLWADAEIPAALTRAAKLLRHAEALVKSPKCTGKEQKMAWEDLRRGADAYTQARDALLRGEKPDVADTLRRIAERVSLAAARAAKACAAGQLKLPTTKAADTVPMQPVWPPTAAPHAAPTKPKRTKKAPEVDPAKDKALVDAFADAIKQAAAQMGPA